VDPWIFREMQPSGFRDDQQGLSGWGGKKANAHADSLGSPLHSGADRMHLYQNGIREPGKVIQPWVVPAISIDMELLDQFFAKGPQLVVPLEATAAVDKE
jgi:hypothetical protein